MVNVMSEQVKSPSPYEMVKILLEHGKVGFRGCVSKRGNKFSAYFYYEKDEKTGRYNWRLEFIDTNPPQA